MTGRQTIVTEKGQVTIPADVRRALGIMPHDPVEFEVDGEFVKLRRVRSRILDGFGSVPPVHRPEHLPAPREAFEQGVADDVLAEAEE